MILELISWIYLIILIAPTIKLSSTFLSFAVNFRYLRDLPMRWTVL